MSDLWVSVHCEGTGGARHDSKLIERFSRVDGAWYAHVHGGIGNAVLGHARQRGGVEQTRTGYRFECPRCGVNSRVSMALIASTLDTLEANGLDRIDLNTLNALAHNGSTA
ncbi:hypothetical protein [Lentzea flaviverrucosa]|uniref:Uncharacterized protein n=1 Tax=Lentzea flaviverrucosa TaxID=200379 RepID=A0A1H9XNQ6_9PSEU|nr:hypothetical protein [Lentzea flaviverrucosa]RDI19676.1 hypothetical protein DFR72_11630 [Lentzea flaviverrucosa]SES47798.1 hypothetical protein SAMN05216195_11630 [Lentzea flaviverrucosa]